MSRSINSRSFFRIAVSAQAIAFALLVSAAGVALGQDGLGQGTGSASCQLAETSTITLTTAALPLPPFAASGAINIAVDGQGGARCDIVKFDPIEIVAIGFICITPPEEPCPAGIVSCPAEGGGAGTATCTGDCNEDGVVDVSELVLGTNVALELAPSEDCLAADPNGDGVAVDELVSAVGHAVDGCPGGPAGIGIDLVSDRWIGECTGNEDCREQCNTYCQGIGKMPTDSGFGCEGFCDGGDRDGQPCVCDSADAATCQIPDATDCPGGSCNGADGVGLGNICECQCIDAAIGDPPIAGDLTCILGSSINVESGPPCGDGDVMIAVGTRCIPMTTASAQTVVLSANGPICNPSGNVCSNDDDCAEGETCGTAMIGPTSTMGNPGECSAINAGSFSGMGLRGYVNFFGSTIGDLITKNSIDCQ